MQVPKGKSWSRSGGLRHKCDNSRARVVRADYRFCGMENGAGEGIRTLDPNLGKVVLYP
jgi:hypothetical protein